MLLKFTTPPAPFGSADERAAVTLSSVTPAPITARRMRSSFATYASYVRSALFGSIAPWSCTATTDAGFSSGGMSAVPVAVTVRDAAGAAGDGLGDAAVATASGRSASTARDTTARSSGRRIVVTSTNMRTRSHVLRRCASEFYARICYARYFLNHSIVWTHAFCACT